MAERLLDVLIVTHGPNGLSMVENMNLPRVHGVTYVVSWQISIATDTSIPASLRRQDIEIFTTYTKGSGTNRNISIEKAKAPICLIADNDLRYCAEWIQAVIDTFSINPDVELAVFQYDGSPKTYPDHEVSLNSSIPKNFFPAAIELAFRRKSVVGKIHFHEQFGVAAPYEACEDSLFFLDCRRAGLNCRFFPITITSHPHPSTGERPITKKSVAQAEGIYIRYAYGLSGFPRIALCVWRNWRRGRIRFWWGLYHYSNGFFNNRMNRILWKEFRNSQNR